MLPRIAATALDDTIRDLLSAPLTWAVVGCSPSPHRDSHRIAGLLKSRGNRIIPVNPEAAGEDIHGERCEPGLTALPAGAGVDVVDIFRRSDAAGVHVDEAIAIGARAVWMQLGVVDFAAAERARAAGLAVVMDRCPAIEVRRLGLG
jgi:predicted CoA-binding protein